MIYCPFARIKQGYIKICTSQNVYNKSHVTLRLHIYHMQFIFHIRRWTGWCWCWWWCEVFNCSRLHFNIASMKPLDILDETLGQFLSMLVSSQTTVRYSFSTFVSVKPLGVFNDMFGCFPAMLLQQMWTLLMRCQDNFHPC